MNDRPTNILPLLEKIAADRFKSYDIKITPISTGGANFTSLLYLVNIAVEGHDDLKLFVKAAVMGEKMRKQCNIDPYGNERFVYTELATVYRQLEDRHGIAEEQHLRFPKYYGADSTYFHETIVLEDLACQGFVLQDRLEPVDWEYAAAAVTELAKFHALSIAYEHEKPEEFTKVSQRFRQRLFNEDEESTMLYESSVKTALEAVREENREKLRTFLDQYSMIALTSFYDTSRYPVLTHGDFRPSNMLHKLRKDGTVELILVDHQTLQYGSPVVDLVYFIFTATDGAARAQFYHKLIEHYHSELGRALARFRLDVAVKYSKEAFQQELQTNLPYGLLFSAVFLPMLLVDEEVAPKLDSEMSLGTMAAVTTGPLYKQRLNEVVDDYVAWGILT